MWPENHKLPRPSICSVNIDVLVSFANSIQYNKVNFAEQLQGTPRVLSPVANLPANWQGAGGPAASRQSVSGLAKSHEPETIWIKSFKLNLLVFFNGNKCHTTQSNGICGQRAQKHCHGNHLKEVLYLTTRPEGLHLKNKNNNNKKNQHRIQEVQKAESWYVPWAAQNR